MFIIMNDPFSMLDDPGATSSNVLAGNLRRMRIARHLSLSQLASATGMSKATLSGIENARTNPTLGTLAVLAGALSVSLAELLEAPAPGAMLVVRSGEGTRAPAGDMPRRLLDELGAVEKVEVAEISLQPGEAYKPSPPPKGARAHLYVRSGRLVAGPIERPTELSTGDYAAFPLDTPHLYEAVRLPATALLLTS
jgi:transcriptional regulator with XRE-family HTH domain